VNRSRTARISTLRSRCCTRDVCTVALVRRHRTVISVLSQLAAGCMRLANHVGAIQGATSLSSDTPSLARIRAPLSTVRNIVTPDSAYSLPNDVEQAYNSSLRTERAALCAFASG
jgi:hypothetical protein